MWGKYLQYLQSIMTMAEESNLNSKGIINRKVSGLSILLFDMTTFLNSNALCVFHTSFTFRVTSCYKYFRLDLY